jgi:hypothetical protein
MALRMLYLIDFTLIASLACYLVGLILRKFVSGYDDFQYRLSLPIIACCVGSIASLLIISQLMSLFLIDALYRFELVRQYPELIIGAINVAVYAAGGYYSTKYTVRLAHKLDMRRIAKRNSHTLQSNGGISLHDVQRQLFESRDVSKTNQVKE